jgi:hypothetical protein
MSYINICKQSYDAEQLPPGVPGPEDSGDIETLRDGEELMAAYRLIKLLDEMDEGEALIVWKIVT